jgi:ankyrin repeat protein
MLHVFQEGTRSGDVDVVKYLVQNGSNINEPTTDGHTPLYYAKENWGSDHPIVAYLESLGAVDAGPDL